MDIEFENMIVDEMTGWLIPIEDSRDFESKFNAHHNLDEFDCFFIWCIPIIEEKKLKIEFKEF